MTMKKISLLLTAFILSLVQTYAAPLDALQRRFVDLRFGMFIHFNMPTYVDEDWPDPDASPELFNPVRLDCRQWAKAAKSAGMTYGCLTTKHHSGFCIWDTKTTDYSVMSSPFGKDVVREYVDAFREEGLDVMFYYSILDTHHDLRPGWITPEHTEMVKAQLRELLTGYGDITAIIIDGWDAPWSRISYDQIPFEEIYVLIKSIQPDCLVMDLNAAKYPADALFYTDIKSYEQGAGQHIDKESNALPALSCLPVQKNWFWKTSFPETPVKDVDFLVNENLVPMGKAYCNFILNVAPNRDGLMDDNALKALEQIGKAWEKAEPGAPERAVAAASRKTAAEEGKTDWTADREHKHFGKSLKDSPDGDMRFSGTPAPITASNLAKGHRAESSWSYDTCISDFAVDDDFESAWVANAKADGDAWLQVYLDKELPMNMIVLTEEKGSEIRRFRIDLRHNGLWDSLTEVYAGTDKNVSPESSENGEEACSVKKRGSVTVLRFGEHYADAVRLTVLESRPAEAPDGVYRSGSTIAVSELGVYHERRQH